MFVRISALLTTLIATLVALGQAAPKVDPLAYHECTSAASNQNGSRAAAIEKCLESAKAGIPGAQYALGALLVDRNEAGDHTAGVEWLEKAAATGHPAAALTLAGVLLQENSPASLSRGRDLLKASICAGYPQALAVMKQQGVTREQIACGEVPEEDFTGEWIAELKWLKSGLAAADNTTYQLKVVIAGDNTHVFSKNGNDWFEVKPGLFKIVKHKRTVVLSAMDSGWDFDGEWIETWTIALLRTGPDDAAISYMRTVNNANVPPSIGWRSFSSYSEGVARRSKK